MSPFRNTHCMLRKHLVQFGIFLSFNLITKCGKDLTASISKFCWWKLQIWIERLESRKRLWLFGAWSTLYPMDPECFSCPSSHSFPLKALGLQWEEGFLPGKHLWSFLLQTGHFLEDQTAVLRRLGLAWPAALFSELYLTTPFLGWCWKSPCSDNSHWNELMFMLHWKDHITLDKCHVVNLKKKCARLIWKIKKELIIQYYQMISWLGTVRTTFKCLHIYLSYLQWFQKVTFTGNNVILCKALRRKALFLNGRWWLMRCKVTLELALWYFLYAVTPCSVFYLHLRISEKPVVITVYYHLHFCYIDSHKMPLKQFLAFFFL